MVSGSNRSDASYQVPEVSLVLLWHDTAHMEQQDVRCYRIRHTNQHCMEFMQVSIVLN